MFAERDDSDDRDENDAELVERGNARRIAKLERGSSKAAMRLSQAGQQQK